MPDDTKTISRRAFLATAGTAVAAASLAAGPLITPAPTRRLRIQRLAWAGLRIDLGDITLFVDPTHTGVEDGLPDAAITTEAKNAFALITHHHSDHYDPAVLKAAVGDKGAVLAFRDSLGWMNNAGLRMHAVDLHRPVFIPNFGDNFVVTAVPAVDGFGHPQVSWVIAVNGKKIFHGGDTLWHGHWWDIAQTHGPFDAVFLPINGFRMPRGRFKSAEMPMDLTPEQAASAAWVLGAKLAVPMHYGAAKDPEYIETENAESRFIAASANHQVPTRVIPVGEWIEL